MKLSTHLEYFTVSIDHIIHNKILISFILFIDYFFTMIRIPAIINRNSFYYQISLCSFLKVLYGLDNVIILVSLSVSIFAVQFLFFICKAFMSSRMPTALKYIFVNIYELFLLRFGLIVFSDIHMTFLVYVIRKDTTEYYMTLLVFIILSSIYYGGICKHISVYHLYGYVTFDYPYDSFSTTIDMLMIGLKIISPFYFTFNEENFLKRVIPGLLLVLAILISLYCIYIMIYHSYCIMKNLVYNKIRIGVILIFTTLGLCESIAPIADANYMWSICFGSIGLFFLAMMIVYNEVTSIPLSNKNNIINLLYFHSNYNAIQERNMLMDVCEKLQEHHAKCANCRLCIVYSETIVKDTDTLKSHSNSHSYLSKKRPKPKKDNEKEKSVVTLDMLINLYKKLNKDDEDYFNILLVIIDKLATQNTSKGTTNNSLNAIDTSFNLRLKLFYFLRKRTNSNPTTLINVNYIFNKHFGATLRTKADHNSNTSNSNSNSNNNNMPIEIEHINDYITRFQIAFKGINDYLNSSITSQAPQAISQCAEYIEVLKSKKYRLILTNNHFQQQYYCLLLSIVYEQFLNTSLNKMSQIIDEESLYEEIIETHYQNDRQITLKINVLTWDILIIQIGHELIEFLNKDFKEIFPSEFSKEEIEVVKEKVTKEDNRMLLVLKLMLHSKEKRDKNKEGEVHKEGHSIKPFTFLELRLIKFSHCSVSNHVLAQGIYVINRSDLIVTKRHKNGPHVLYGVNNHSPNLSNSNNIQLIVKNGYQLNKTPHVIYSLYHNMFQYDIGFLDSIETHNEATALHKLDEIHLSSMNSNYVNINNWNFNCTMSMMSSINGSSSMISASQTSSALFGIRQAAKSKKKNKKWMKRIFAFLIGFSVLMILYSFISMFFEIKMVNTLKSNYDVFVAFRRINRQYYHTIASIISNTCVGHLNSSVCVNYMGEYGKRIYNAYKNEIDLISLIHKENVLKLIDLQVRFAKVEQSVYALNDPVTSGQFELLFEYYQITLKDNVMVSLATNITFRDGMKRLINSMSFIVNDLAYTNEPIYLITVKPINFDNVFNQKDIKDAQLEYYHIIINYGNFLVRWFSIYDALNTKIAIGVKTLKFTVLVIMIGTLTIHIVLIALITVLVNFYWANAINSLNVIQGDKSNPIFFSWFNKKLGLLTEILLVYKENPNKLIKNIKDCYYQYQNQVSNKKKEGNSLASSTDDSSSSSLLSLPIDTSLYIFFKMDLWFLFSKYIICVISVTVYYILFFIFFLIFWIISVDETNKSFKYINEHARSEATGFSVVTLLQIMVYGNQTRTDISILVHQEDNPDYYANELYIAFNKYYTMEKTQRTISHLVHKLSQDFTLHCDDFYEKSKDHRLTTIINESGGTLLPQLTDLCNSIFPSMNMNDQLMIYKDLSRSVYNTMYSLNRFTYKDLEDFLMTDDLHYIELFTFLVFRPVRRLINDLIYNAGIENIRNRLTAILTSYALISAMTDILSIILLYFVFILNLYKNEKRIKRLTKVFKISDNMHWCNSNNKKT